METVDVLLPRGLALDGAWHRSARVRPVCGSDEAVFRDEPAFASQAARSTALLARCVLRLGPYEPPGEERVRLLSVGDREALLLHVRKLTFGDNVSCVLTCPARECGGKMDLDLKVSALFARHVAAPADRYETVIEGRTVGFRLLNGADQEEAAAATGGGLAAAADLLLRRAVIDGDAPWETLRRELPQRMAELDPQAEILLSATCPVCGSAFAATFDAGSYLCRELSAQRGSLYTEVHHLAFHYHWSEAEILGMSTRKRRRYLELLSDALSEARTS